MLYQHFYLFNLKHFLSYFQVPLGCELDQKKYNSSMSSIKKDGVRFNYTELVGLVRQWNVQFRLKEKYHTWRLKYSLPKVSTAFYRLVEHSLISYIMTNLGWLVCPSPAEIESQLEAMKRAYSQMNLGSSISSQIFNFWMVLLVKLAAYFLSNHVPAVLVDSALECDIYRHTMLKILGIHIEKNTYRILLKMFASKRKPSNDRQSFNLLEDEKKSGDNKQRQSQKENDQRSRTIKSIGRRNGKNQTTLFNNISTINQDRSRMQEIKYLLKSNLYVKPIPRKAEPKHSIAELKQQGKQYSSLQSHARVTPTGKFVIQANQLSQAFSSNYDLRLTEIKNHSIHCSHPKNITRPTLPVKPNRKLEIKRQEDRSEDPRKSKAPKNWNRLVTEMKQELYKGKGVQETQNAGAQGRREDRDYYYMQVETREQVKKQQERKQGQPNQQVFRFRKLDLMNSPNIIVYDDCPIDLNEEEEHTNVKTIRMNRSRLEKSEKRKNNHE